MRLGHHYQIFTTGMQKRKKGGKTETDVIKILKAVCYSVYCFSNHMLAPGTTKVQLYLLSELCSILAARDAASLGII